MDQVLSRNLGFILKEMRSHNGLFSGGVAKPDVPLEESAPAPARRADGRRARTEPPTALRGDPDETWWEGGNKIRTPEHLRGRGEPGDQGTGGKEGSGRGSRPDWQPREQRGGGGGVSGDAEHVGSSSRRRGRGQAKMAFSLSKRLQSLLRTDLL